MIYGILNKLKETPDINYFFKKVSISTSLTARVYRIMF